MERSPPLPPTLVWFRQDLRLNDNPALHMAAETGPVIPVYILDTDQDDPWPMGGASRWWLHASLESLAADLARLGAPLLLRRGPAAAVLRQLVAETGAGAVHWNDCYEPRAIARDRTLKADLTARGVAVRSFNAALLAEPWTVRTGDGGPYKVFTPFWRRLSGDLAAAAAPLPPPASLRAAPAAIAGAITGEHLADWRLLPTTPDWADGLRESWTPGESGAAAALDRFLRDAAADYAQARDLPGRRGTSRLSPHLHFGEISPRQIWAATAGRADDGTTAFRRELGWREFAHHLLFHFPDMPTTPLAPRFAHFPWTDAPDALTAWQRGRTGYPIVDAGMRELWATGWMHNRVRMIVGSFLVKHLLLPWQAGAAWFWDTLVDADLANNSIGWQWIAGCGADAAPYFRVFNPVLQGRKFDTDGHYVRRWVPELADLPDSVLHAPWEASPLILAAAGVTLGRSYPHPIVDHAWARDRALAAFASLKDLVDTGQD